MIASVFSGCIEICMYMMTSSNGNIFRVTGPLCGEFTGPGEFPTQRPVTRSFDVFLDLRLNKRLSKQPWGWWFETPSWSLWRQRNEQDLIHATPYSQLNQCCGCQWTFSMLEVRFLRPSVRILHSTRKATCLLSIRKSPVIDFPHIVPVTQKVFPFDDAIMG